MRRCRAVIFVLVLAIGSTYTPAAANPVPDEIAKEFDSLPYILVEGATPVQIARFEELMGYYGLDLLSPKTVAFIETHFGVLKPHIVAAQAPPHKVNFRLQRRFQDWSTAADRRAMCTSIRGWLTFPLDSVPPTGGMRTTGPPRAVDREIMHLRVTAAEVLSNYGDQESLPLIQALIEADDFTRYDPWHDEFADLRRCLDFAAKRISDPESASLWRLDGNGGVTLSRSMKHIRKIRIRSRTRTADIAGDVIFTPYSPIRDDLVRLAVNLTDGKLARNRGASGILEVEFPDGAIARFDPSGAESLIYQDNTRLERIALEIKGPELNRMIRDIANSFE